MSPTQGSTAANTQQAPVKRRINSMPKIKPATIAVYVGVFALVVAMVSIGYHEPKSSSTVANAANVNQVSQPDQTSVDNVVATGVAAGVAQAANLPIATSVANMAVSAQAKSEFVQSDGISTSKPQIIESSVVNRSVVSYTTVAGDTVSALAVKFGISEQTIKWANNLTTDAISEGKVLKILPVDGVLYTVKSGDTIDSIAEKYGVDKKRLVLNNDLDVGGLVSGSDIILPSGTLPTEERPGYVAPVAAVSYNYYYAGMGAGFGGQTWYISSGTPNDGNYAPGNCTLYASNRRKSLGLPVGSNWGNAGSWAYYARQDGLVVNSTPSAGAIIQDSGHVAIVESVLPNGDLSISEMNAYVPGGGWNIVSGRIVPAGNVGQYLYIH
jgi:surface antigen/LysM repeat protein